MELYVRVFWLSGPALELCTEYRLGQWDCVRE